MNTLGGSLFVRNAIKYDYCVIESIASLLGVCDSVVVFECGSDDGTKELLRAIKSSKLKLYCDLPWQVARDHKRLSIIANAAKNELKTQWHFMLQADEVVHEESYQAIRDAVESGVSSINVRRVNFYGHPWQHVKYDIPLEQKPCDDMPTRLAPLHYQAMGDAESLQKDDQTINRPDIVICHYGFVRDPIKLVNRTVDSLRWFFEDGIVDNRFLKMQQDGEYRWTDIMTPEQMQPFTGTHPKVIKPWLRERWMK